MKKLTKEEFVERAQKIHGNKYDYSEVEYKNNASKIKIYDKELKEYFYMTPACHLNGQENPKRKWLKLRNFFAMKKEDFIKRAQKIHENKYDYSKVEYVNNRTKVKIICPIHGEFLQTPDKHLRGAGCPSCCKKNKKYTTEEFIEKCKKIYGEKYDFSKTIYGKNSKEKVIVTCPEHGDFLISPNSLLNFKKGCKYCTGGQIYNTQDFVKKAKLIHGNKYDYSNTEYKNMLSKVKIICPIHGEFSQKPINHIHKEEGCPECAKRFRKSETKLYDYLVNKFPKEEIIHSYYNKNILNRQEIDIYFPKYKIGVEYQGEQHFSPIDFGGYGKEKANELFLENNNRDKKKKEICDKIGIHLFYFSDTKHEDFLGKKVYLSLDKLYKDLKKLIEFKKEDEKNS